MKRILYIALLVLSALPGKAQQDPLFTQYMFNRLLINPAYAGSREQLSMVGIWRQQWTGWDGAPVTQSFGLHTPTPDQRHGFGLHLLNDKVGFTSNTLASFSYAYRIPVGEGKLALGLTAGMNSYRVALTEVETWQQGDVSFENGGDFTRWLIQAGPGIYYSNKRWYGGLSIPNLVPNRLYDDFYEQLIAHKSRHYFLTAGYLLQVAPWLQFRPSILAKYTRGAPFALDLSGAFLIKDRILLGASFRPQNAVCGMFQLYLTKLLRLGYSYDHSISSLSNYLSGSHEFMLGFDLGFQKVKMVSPKLF